MVLIDTSGRGADGLLNHLANESMRQPVDPTGKATDEPSCQRTIEQGNCDNPEFVSVYGEESSAPVMRQVEATNRYDAVELMRRRAGCWSSGNGAAHTE